MPSKFDTAEITEAARYLNEFGETVIRRMGGQSDRTEPVLAIVDFDEKISQKIAIDIGGLIDSDRGQYIDVIGLLDVRADQEVTPDDTWLVDGEVYRTHGVDIGKDAGCRTIIIHQRINKRGRSPRVRR